MTEPEKTRHEKMKEHLRAATKHLHTQRAAAQEGIAAHLAANPVVAADTSTPTTPTTTQPTPT